MRIYYTMPEKRLLNNVNNIIYLPQSVSLELCKQFI